jgi:purine-binding chemotaxis protein CheW
MRRMTMLTETVSDLTQYLTFSLDKDLFAVNVARVLNVLEMIPITHIPRVPPFMRGVINLRGNVLPVIDLRVKFSLPVPEDNIDTSIIVLQLEYEGTILEVGAVADSVEEVINLGEKDIEPPPSMGSKLDSSFIKGMGKMGDQFVIILDIDKIISEKDLVFKSTLGKK